MVDLQSEKTVAAVAQALFDRACDRAKARGHEPHHPAGTFVRSMPHSYRHDYEEDARAMIAAFYLVEACETAPASAQALLENATKIHLVASPSHALLDLIAERQRQVAVEGWTPEHDDQHSSGEMAMAAALYAAPAALYRVEVGSTLVGWSDPWPWKRRVWGGREQAGDMPSLRVNDGDGREKHDRRKRLVIAGALILAEIERLDRNSPAWAKRDVLDLRESEPTAPILVDEERK